METEVWKDIEGYEGLYQISSRGRVRSLKFRHTNTIRILKPYKNKKGGYLVIGLHKDKKMKLCQIQRLVAEAFIPNPDNLPQVNHKNEMDKTDNRVEALEWCDAKYNSNYGTRNQRVAEKLSKPVLQYDLEGNFIKEWASSMEVERVKGYNHSHIANCCNGKRKKACGYIWKYAA